MLKLDHKLNLTRRDSLESITRSSNLLDRFTHEDCRRLGARAKEGFDRDESSRSRWLARTETALDLALQLQKAKSFPWPDCSNVAFPLVTIAAMQFHARSYPALINGAQVVKYRVPDGTPDPAGLEYARASRIGSLMSRQCLEDDEAWEEQHDRLLLALPILGCMFVKTRHSSAIQANVSELVMPHDLVLNYFSKSVDSAPRKTHLIELHRNDIYERIERGLFSDVRGEGWYQSYPTTQTTTHSARADTRKGEAPPPPDENTPFRFLEQHVSLDLDKDGYAEPYILTVEQGSSCPVRLVSRWERPEDVQKTAVSDIITITASEHFTKYTFIPSPDGGIYDLGFGILLGPLNESVNTMINQIIDAATMSTTAGGFLARGAKMRGGAYAFQPFMWQRVDSSGDDIRKSMLPLPVREPSMVLFNLLSLLIDYTNRISGATDPMVGENPGQNTTAETMRTMTNQGMKIFADTFKRVWRGMKGEFKKLYLLNAVHLSGEDRKDFLGDPRRVVPVADPIYVSQEQEMQQVLAMKQSAMTTPGYDVAEVERRFLKVLRIEGVDKLYPGPDKVPPLPNPKLMVEQAKQQGVLATIKSKDKQFALKLMSEKEKVDAEVLNLRAQAAKAMAEAGGVAEGNKIAAFEATIKAHEAYGNMIAQQLELLMKGAENESGNAAPADKGGMGGVAGQPAKPLTLPDSAAVAGGNEGGVGGG